jgi:mono/diheme cytochrome c family protein
MRPQRIVIAASLCCIVLLVECSSKRGDLLNHVPAVQAARPNPLASDPKARQAGARLYASRCASCHGKDREGIGKAPALANSRIYDASPGALFWTVRSGAVFGGMPSFADITAQQRWQIVSFLKEDHTGSATRSH